MQLHILKNVRCSWWGPTEPLCSLYSLLSISEGRSKTKFGDNISGVCIEFARFLRFQTCLTVGHSFGVWTRKTAFAVYFHNRMFNVYIQHVFKLWYRECLLEVLLDCMMCSVHECVVITMSPCWFVQNTPRSAENLTSFECINSARCHHLYRLLCSFISMSPDLSRIVSPIVQLISICEGIYICCK